MKCILSPNTDSYMLVEGHEKELGFHRITTILRFLRQFQGLPKQNVEI